MASVNKVILIGNLGRDPETRYLPDGGAVTNASIATTDVWKDKAGEKQERTEWHRLSFFGRLAEIAGEYLKKGSSVYVEGKLQTRKWTDKDGVDRYTTEIVVNDMKMLGGKPPEGSAQDYADRSGGRGTSTQPAGRARQPETTAAGAGAKRSSAFDQMDDDIPF